jgi:hemerythrin-like domain-containing protein
MEKRMGPGGPVSVMRGEHERIESCLEAIAGEQDLSRIRAIANDFFKLARQHFAKEEQVLFLIARQQLGDELLEAKALDWAARRHVSVG